ncbi:MAG: DNA-directed RNA polymerase subunit alpha [Bacteroidales bacterium]|nr:DNA-directed RNA polymerase subunit alpha [Bacteroidales bacterium]MDD3989359.1 DNA-directed RNA polymerase subunit alpha [Bacteroidales bacterium]MDD4639043.1 DNA-directed RNA polymerase subunit alpha [Bacteroidales bacterium]
MAILAFQKPDKVIMLDATETFGRFEFRPLEPGYGITVGNALRRILLSSLEGYAITAVKIQGVDHEFATIPGVIETVVDIILNLKQVRFKRMIESEDSEIVNVSVNGKQSFTAEDISKNLSSFKVLNPELHICTMEPSVKLSVELRIGKGRGYVPSEENRPEEDTPLGLIPVDSIFTPIKNVKYSVENWRVEQKTDYEKLNIEITTDGSIHPKEALKEAAKILIHHFMLFSDEKITLETPVEVVSSELDEESLRMRHLLMTKLADMELSVRALNCLKAAEIETFAELVSLQRSELMKFRNFGKKSLAEIDNLVERYKLNFGMDVTKYNIEKKVLKHEAQ